MADKISLFVDIERVIDVECSTSQSAISGNFFGLVGICLSTGDTALIDHFVNAPKNAIYISPDIQNQVIQVLGDHIRGKVLRRVQKAHCFTIIADEVTDCSNKEQLCLALRYVNPDNYVILVIFIECDDGMTGQARP